MKREEKFGQTTRKIAKLKLSLHFRYVIKIRIFKKK